MRVETNGRAYEGDFLFGAVTNSASVGGVLKYDPRIVNMNDGKLEILLIHKPRNPVQLFSIIRSLVSNKFSDNPLIEFDRSDKFKIYPSARSDWSLDGEFAYTTGSSEIKCLKSKIRLLCPQTVK
jgi:diacylglycerol kinase family enzyme